MAQPKYSSDGKPLNEAARKALNTAIKHSAQATQNTLNAKKPPYPTAKTSDEAVAMANKKRGVGKPGFSVGPRHTSPVPGMSRTKAAINSLTIKGRAENVGRIEAVWNDERFKPGKTQISSMANVRGRILGGGLGGMFGIKNR